MNCLSKSYRIFRLLSAIWLISDMIFHIIQTEQYFVLSPYLYNYHEANLNLSERIEEFCTQLNQTEFNQTLITETQKNLHDKWMDICDNSNFLAAQSNTSLQEQQDFVKEDVLCSSRKTFIQIQILEPSIQICTPEISSGYFVLSVLNFLLTPVIFSTFWILVYDDGQSLKKKIRRNLSDYFRSSCYVYLAIPFCALFYGIYGFIECIANTKKVKKLHIFRNYVTNGSEVPFLALFEQFCLALPQLLIAAFFCINNCDNHSFPIAYATINLSGISFLIGLITSLCFGRSVFMKLCDAEFMRIKNYDYENPEFFQGRSPERQTSSVYTYSDILNVRAEQVNPQAEIFYVSE